jgi:hypothetical protein
MDTRVFFTEVQVLKDLLKLPDSFSTRYKIKKSKKRLHKMISAAADAQAVAMYHQTYNLYQDIVDSNLNEK